MTRQDGCVLLFLCRVAVVSLGLFALLFPTSLGGGFWSQRRPALLLLAGGTLSIVLSLSASHYQNSSETLISS